MRPKLSIIIPACNEEKRISKTLDDLVSFFGKKKHGYEIMVMMDGCTDRTPEIVEEKAKKNRNIRYSVHEERLGKGGALLEAFSLVNGEFVSYVDADGSTPPRELSRLLDMIGDSDVIIGSRWMDGSVLSRRQPLSRRIASRGFNFLTRTILGLPFNDTQCSAKIFRRRVVKDIAKRVRVTNFAVDACMLYAAMKAGCGIKEVPIRWEDRDMSTVKISKVAPAMLVTVIKMRLGLAGKGEDS